MILRLFNTVDGRNVINKTLVDEIQMNINLKSDTNVVNPDLTLLCSDGFDGYGYNYAKIDELNRYYFVDDVISVSSKLVILSLSCDVLETYKGDILASESSYFRSMKPGDYYKGDVDESVIKNFTKYESNKGFDEYDRSLILTTIGV